MPPSPTPRPDPPPATPRPKVAFFDFTSCEGCQLTVLDALQTHPELLEVVEIVEFREASSERAPYYDIAFIEGSCSRPQDEARLQDIRERAGLVVALGACAHLGGINAIRNRQALPEVRRYVYGDRASWYATYEPRALETVIRVDAVIPGCPIDREEFVRLVSDLVQGRPARLPEYPVCLECKLRGTVCRYMRNQPCLGPVSRGGCQAICPAYGFTCVGCRGLISQPAGEALYQTLAGRGLSEAEIDERLTLFLTNQTPKPGRLAT